MKTSVFDTRKLIMILGGFVLVVISFVILLRNGVGTVMRLYGELKNQRQEITILKENIQLIRRIDLTVMSKSDQVFVALPDRSLLPVVVANMKNISAGKLNVSTFKSEIGQAQNDINMASLVYEGDASSIEDMLGVLDSLQGYLPLTAVESLEMSSGKGSGFQVSLKIATFWSKIPSELPEINEPVKDLTDDENKLMTDLARLKRPISDVLNPLPPTDRQNPFI